MRPSPTQRLGAIAEPAAPTPASDDVFAASLMQESMWLAEQMLPGASAYNLPEAWRCRCAVDIPALQRSLDLILARHEALRTTFSVRAGVPRQVIQPPAPFALAIADLRGAPEAETALQQCLEAEARRPFDLACGPLARALLVRLAEHDQALLFNFHHLIADEWSLGIFRHELAELYSAAVEGRGVTLPELPIQYADFAVWQRDRLEQGLLTQDLAFWRERLRAPLPVIELPADHVNSGGISLRGTTQYHTLPRQLLDQLKGLGRQQGVTLFMTMLAGLQALLHRYTRQTDLIVGSPLGDRESPELEGLIGLFVNTQALRVDVSDDPTFATLLGRAREATIEAKAHQNAPLHKILLELQLERTPGRHPLFPVVFGLQPSQPQHWGLSGVSARRIEVDNGGAKFDWTLLGSETSEGLCLRSEHRADLFEPGTVQRWLRHLERLLASAAAEPNRRLSELEMLGESEKCQLISALNPVPAVSLAGPCLHEWFGQQAQRAPNNVAATFESKQLTYGELEKRANQLANRLQSLGVGPEVPVALCLERSLDLAVAILGVLKAGGIYVPIDPATPGERIAFIVQDTGARVLLTQERLRAALAPGLRSDNPPAVVCLDAEAERLAVQPVTAPVSGVKPENTAYIIYTSGSTGQPKGVMVTHYNVVRLLEQTQRWFGFGDGDVWTLFHSYTFDFSVWELWGAWLYGGRLVIVPYLVSRSPREFLDLLVREKVTVLNQTPSAFRQLMWQEAAVPTPPLALRYVIFGGEALELQSLKPWLARHGDQQPLLVNMYGITETTVHVTYRVIRQQDVEGGLGSVIGVPIPDLRLYVLDERLQPVPVGVPGELCVGGAGVARGYLNRPELTGQRFVADPWSQRPEARLYRSGDLARLTAGGELEYLGRIDHQVKIRGFRVELGEIESALNRHGAVKESVVVAAESAAGRRLVAYLVPRQEPPTPAELRSHLEQFLPDYMIPSVFVTLTALPLTVNGKVDRRALPCAEAAEQSAPGSQVAPRNETERRIAAIWCHVLARPSVGVHDNFFHLGGHSLLASQVAAQLTAEFQLDIPVRLLFDSPTVAQLAEELARADQGRFARASAIPRLLAADQARQMLARLDQLSESEVEELLRQSEDHQISA